jgi:hypothetical protein
MFKNSDLQKIKFSLYVLVVIISISIANTPKEEDVTWHDCQTLTVEGQGWGDTNEPYDRLPAKAYKIVRSKVWDLSRCSSGLCVRFSTNARAIKVRWTLNQKRLAMGHMPATGVSGVDLYTRTSQGRWCFVSNARPKGISTTADFKLPDESEFTLNLPLYNGIKKIEIGIPKDKNISGTAGRAQSKAIIFYGTSITQGGCASRPGMAYPTIVGRKLDVPTINLGFSGNGKMDLEIADLLCEVTPSIYVIDCLANMSEELIKERAEPFLDRLRKSRPKTPIVLVEDSNLKNEPTKKGIILRNIYQKRASKDSNLYFLSNIDLIGSDTDATVDGGHLSDLGMMRQSKIFTDFLRNILEH